jgi:hypothetical protein
VGRQRPSLGVCSTPVGLLPRAVRQTARPFVRISVRAIRAAGTRQVRGQQPSSLRSSGALAHARVEASRRPRGAEVRPVHPCARRHCAERRGEGRVPPLTTTYFMACVASGVARCLSFLSSCLPPMRSGRWCALLLGESPSHNISPPHPRACRWRPSWRPTRGFARVLRRGTTVYDSKADRCFTALRYAPIARHQVRV